MIFRLLTACIRLSLALILWLPIAVHAQKSATVVVDAARIVAPVNRLVFGQNIDAADNAYIFSSNSTDPNLIQRGDGFWDPDRSAPIPEIVQQSKAIGMSMLRYPGGCLAHNFDWRNAVGPESKANGWKFGLDEYLKLCGAIGAVPVITVSDYVLPADEMPTNAAELVEYLNSPADAAHPWAQKRKAWGHPDPYDVKWFELGNESIHGNHRVLPHRQYTAEQYAAYARATGAAMRKVDPRIRIGLVMMPGAGTDANCDWNRTVVRLAGSVADFVVIHLYVPQEPGSGVAESVLMASMMVAPEHVEERLGQYHSMIRAQLGHDLPLAISEFNGGLDQTTKPYRFSFGDALECADLIRVFLEPESGVAFANYFNFLNGYYGMLRTTEDSPTGEPSNAQPMLLLYGLWAQHFGTDLVKVDVQAPTAEFPGAGSEEASRGVAYVPRSLIENFDLGQYATEASTRWTEIPNLQIAMQQSGFTIHLKNLHRALYPLLARIPRPVSSDHAPVELAVEFDARFVPGQGSDSAPMGLGLMDSRGWAATHSGIGIDDIASEWKHFTGSYTPTNETPSVDVTARLMPDRKAISGTLEIRDLTLAAFVSARTPAYSLLTAAASVSPDRKEIYLIVFNKSSTDDIASSIRVANASATRARYWEVTSPSLDTIGAASLTRQSAPLELDSFGRAMHTFPAHSMTAIEFSK